MDFLIYSDEVKNMKIGDNSYTFIGSLFIPQEVVADVREILKKLRSETKVGEVKWKKVRKGNHGHIKMAFKLLGSFFSGEWGDCTYFFALGIAENTLSSDRFGAGKKYHEFYATYYGRFYRAQIKGGINYLVECSCLKCGSQQTLFGNEDRVIGVFHDGEGNLEENMSKSILRKVKEEVCVEVYPEKIHFLDSRKSDFIQLADLLLGYSVYSIRGFEGRDRARDEILRRYPPLEQRRIKISEFLIEDDRSIIRSFLLKKYVGDRSLNGGDLNG